MTRTDRILESLHFALIKMDNATTEREFYRELRRVYSLQYRLSNQF